MGRKKKSEEMPETVDSGEQLDLIDVAPENAMPIIRAARLYKKFQAARQAALEKEIEQKQQVLELVRAAKLPPLEGGIIRFSYDGVVVSVTPRDELVRIKDKAEETE